MRIYMLTDLSNSDAPVHRFYGSISSLIAIESSLGIFKMPAAVTIYKWNADKTRNKYNGKNYHITREQVKTRADIKISIQL